MGRPTILRIPEGIELLPEMEEKLKSLIGDFDLPEKFGEDNRIIDAMFERMQALQNGFKFLLGAYDEPLFHLDDCASRVRHILKKQLDDEDNAEQLLRRYAHILIDVLVWKLNITPQEALHQLNRAEQYYLMTQVRPVVATLSLCNENSTRFMLQCDTPKKAFAEETIRELKHISAFADEYGTSQPDLPHWFQKLKPEFRAFILLAKSSGYKRDDLVFLLKELVRMWQENQTVMTDKTYQFISNFSLTGTKKFCLNG